MVQGLGPLVVKRGVFKGGVRGMMLMEWDGWNEDWWLGNMCGKDNAKSRRDFFP